MTTIRPLEADDDLTPEIDLRHRAFGPIGSGHHETLIARAQACVVDGRLLGAFDGGQMVGSARYFDLRQWWHGRAMPLAGVAGVKIAPEARGRGIGRTLMTGLLSAMAERGYPLSLLYPSSLGFYRALGWEQAGGFYLAEIPGRALTTLVSPDPEAALPGWAPPGRAGAVGGGATLRRAGSADAEEVLAVIGAVHAATLECGPSTFDVDSVRRDLAGDDHFSYLADDGFLSYYWDGSMEAIDVSILRAASARTAATLWGIVGSHAAQARTVRAVVGPRDPIGWLTAERDVETLLRYRWMLRVIDPVAAVAGRGYPRGVQMSVALRLADAALPKNAGCYTLSVTDGSGSLVKTGSAGDGWAPPEAVAFGPRGFAALFAGVPMATLRVAGLAAGGDQAADSLLDCAFACVPFMIDAF
ncbi:MAG TPA: GNAT family N-acetyltransferase [Streptosporangiaceae bacterium]|nr:GNAT family N-acetyltransferase [Streptosporangiaceae bacterium]